MDYCKNLMLRVMRVIAGNSIPNVEKLSNDKLQNTIGRLHAMPRITRNIVIAGPPWGFPLRVIRTTMFR